MGHNPQPHIYASKGRSRCLFDITEENCLGNRGDVIYITEALSLLDKDPVTKDRSQHEHSARGRARGNSLPFDEPSDSDFEQAGERKTGAPIIANSSTSATLVEGGKPHLPPPPGAAL